MWVREVGSPSSASNKYSFRLSNTKPRSGQPCEAAIDLESIAFASSATLLPRPAQIIEFSINQARRTGDAVSIRHGCIASYCRWAERNLLLHRPFLMGFTEQRLLSINVAILLMSDISHMGCQGDYVTSNSFSPTAIGMIFTIR